MEGRCVLGLGVVLIVEGRCVLGELVEDILAFNSASVKGGGTSGTSKNFTFPKVLCMEQPSH